MERVDATMKAGLKTTEFYLSLLVVVLSAVMTSGLIAEQSTVARIITAIVAALSALGYTAARTYLKARTSSRIEPYRESS